MWFCKSGVTSVWLICGVFFFKQKTAYEMLRSLVGSEMCIRDRVKTVRLFVVSCFAYGFDRNIEMQGFPRERMVCVCLLYTSDAADDLLCVDLGGRRIIKKKK